MRHARLITNETCGLRCRFCDARRGHERESVAGAASIRARIDALGNVDELVITGGEPTRREDLPRIIAYARARTSARIVLETNATELAPDLPDRLAAAGLDRARVHIPAWGDDLDRFAGVTGAGARLAGGIAMLTAAGLELEASTPVVADNLHLVADLPLTAAVVADNRHHGADPAVQTAAAPKQHPPPELPTILRPLVWYVRIPWDAPDPSTLAPLAEAAAQVARFADVATVPVRLDPDAFLPPCLFARPARVARLFALNPGAATRPGYRQPPECAQCRLVDACPGIPIDMPVAPIAEDRVRRRLTVISSVEEQVQRELVTHEIYRDPDGTTRPAAIVRINFQCNQACRFCFVSTHLPAAPDSDIEAAIDDIGARGGIVALSGGEPTLNPRLPELVRRAKDAGVALVELQTNAVRLDGPGRADALAEAGVDVAFVSLHGATAATSDAITDAPGTHARTLVGLDRLAAAGIRVRINFVLCGPNHAEFPAFVELVAQRWPKAAINCSFVAPSTDLVPRTADLIPRYADVMPSLRDGVATAHRLGVELGGFDSMCGIPLCLVPGELEAFFGLAEVPPGYDQGEFLKPAACGQCVLEPRCFGIRRGYAELYGTAELQPVSPRS